jgi:hypothetical protein
MRSICRITTGLSGGSGALFHDYATADVDWTADVDISIRVTSVVATNDVIQGYYWLVEAL